MGLDGFSISDLRMHKEFTSAQMSNKAEQLASQGTQFKIKDVDQMEKDVEIKRKEKNDEEQKQKKKKKGEQNFEDFFEESGSDENLFLDINDTDKEEKFVDPFETRNASDYAVRINPRTEMIELFNKKDKKVMETITAEELMNLISKLNSASGILVNKKI